MLKVCCLRKERAKASKQWGGRGGMEEKYLSASLNCEHLWRPKISWENITGTNCQLP